MKHGCVNTDASYADGIAGVSYASPVIGEFCMIIRAECSTEAELRALLMAMNAAHKQGFERLTFRADSIAAAKPRKVHAPRLRAYTVPILDHLWRHDHWHLCHVPRRSNVRANHLARRALRDHLADAPDHGMPPALHGWP